VLTVTGLSDAEYLISSVALSIDEYYAGVGESPGVWAGRWAEALGLSGVVEADQLRALVDGKHPTSGADLLAGSRPRSVLAFDLTFSAPLCRCRHKGAYAESRIMPKSSSSSFRAQDPRRGLLGIITGPRGRPAAGPMVGSGRGRSPAAPPEPTRAP
jgi:hypothetical protein